LRGGGPGEFALGIEEVKGEGGIGGGAGEEVLEVAFADAEEPGGGAGAVEGAFDEGAGPGGTGGIPAKYETVTLEQAALYRLSTDRAETTDVAAAHPEVVARLQAFAAKCRAELGDSLTKRQGSGVREPGRIEGAPTKKKAKSG
jgi:hypothetical protein